MSDTADRYRKLSAAFTDTVEAVPADRWNAPTPCEGWSVRDVVGHVTESSGWFLGFIERPLPEGPARADDPAGAWVALRDAIRAALDDPATAATEYDGAFGTMTFEGGVDMFLCFDLLVHRWDIARAAGLEERLDPDEVTKVFETARPMDEALRSPGAFGPKIEPPAGADEQTQLLAFLGRSV